MTTPQTLTYETTGRIARIKLDRPERGNGITRRMITELEQCVEQADLDPAVHAILLSGNGKGFCGGYDLVESAEGQGRLGEEGLAPPPGSPLDPMTMAANHDPSGTWDPMVDYAMMSRNVRGFMSLFHCGKPVVCKVHGFCVAGGTDGALLGPARDRRRREDRLSPGAGVGLSHDLDVDAPAGTAACQAAALHRRLALGRGGARSGGLRSRPPPPSGSTSARRSCLSGSPKRRSTSCA